MNKILTGDAIENLRGLPDKSVQCCVTSPPYWGLRDYGVRGQLGLEKTPEEFVKNLVAVFREVKRVLKNDGTLWLNLGDSYNGTGAVKYQKNSPKQSTSAGAITAKAKNSANLKPKDLVGIPWRVAFALQSDGWYLRQEIIWSKPNPMPESVQGSHFYRHRVTIEEYEKLQRMWPTKSPNQDGSGNLPSLSERKISNSKTALSEKPEGNGNCESKRTKTESNRKTKPIFGDSTGQTEQKKIFGDTKGSGKLAETLGELSSTTSECGGGRDSTGLDGHSGPPQLSLFLLQPEKFENDSRPRDPVEQRREKLARERSASLPQMQLHKKGQNRVDAKEKIECPGCYKCENQNGFIFTLSAGRCTKSHESIFLLTKSPRYFYDHEAIMEPANFDGRKDTKMKGSEKYQNGFVPNSSPQTVAKKGHERWPNKLEKIQELRPGEKAHSGYFNADGTKRFVELDGCPARNKRSVWEIATQPFSMGIETSRLFRAEQDEVSDDTKRIVFPNCPNDADFFDSVSSDVCGECEDDLLSRIERIDSHLSQEQVSGFSPTARKLVYYWKQQNSGSSLLSHFFSATIHSNENRKTVHDLLTNLSYNSFVKILSRIDDTRDGLLLSALYLGTHGNKISLDGLDARLLDKIPFRNVGKSFCSSCQHYTIKTEKSSHFAVFPEKIPEICIKAGSREGDTILDPFFGSGTTGLVAQKAGRKYIGIELNPDFVEVAKKRLAQKTIFE